MELRIDLPQELFAPAESLSFGGTYKPEVFKAGPDFYTFEEPLVWNVIVSNTGEAFLVSGTVEGTGICGCARCLNDASIDFYGEIEGYFIINPESTNEEELDEDEFSILGEDHCIDLVPLINAALLLDAPNVPLCADECKGLCPQCGKNLNEGDCECMSDESEPLKENPFSVLKDYQFED